MNSPSDVWMRVLSIMEQELTSTAVNAWFEDSFATELSESRIVICTPSQFKKDIIQTRYAVYIQKALRELFASDMQVVVLKDDELNLQEQAAANQNLLMGSDEYTFDRFVVGSSNRFAYNAAIAVSNEPASKYNPLFLYGDSGLGKTHLLYSISRAIGKSHPEFHIVYIKGDDFTNELIMAIRSGKNDQFRTKYREADLLLVDDIQFIAGKEATQEEFFHTFNTLYEAKKQIVLTSDRPPNEMVRLENRLRTRFEQGLIADIQPPDYETRLAIIKNKAILLGLDLPDAILEYIAENITSNVRQLEGTVRKILAYRELLSASVDIDTVIRAVRDLILEKDSFMPSPQEIIEETADYFSISPQDILGQSRTKELVQARQISMYLIRKITSLSLNDIGKVYGKDHSTVVHSLEKIDSESRRNRELEEIIKDITSKINSKFN